MLESIYDIINYPIIEKKDFIFSPLNIIIIIGIYLIAIYVMRFFKGYFKLHKLTSKQLRIEGKEFAVWKLVKQIVYFLALFLSILSLLINNDHINSSQILEYNFFKLGDFHIAVYHIFYVTIVYFFARLSLNLLSISLIKSIRKKKGDADEGTEYVYVQLAKYVVYIIAFIVIIRSFGVNMDAVTWFATALLVGVGVGLQNIFRDYFSGLLLLFEGNIKVGDIIEIDYLSGKQDLIAKVNEINLRSTKIESVDGKVLIIPNSKLTQENVNNWNLDKKLTRFKIPVSVAYGSDTELVTEILINCATAHPIVNSRKPPFVRLLNFGDNGLEMDLVFWGSQHLNIETHKSEIRFAIDKTFRENGIVIPFPQRDINYKSNPPKD